MHKPLALVYGLTTHALFAAGVGAMARGLYLGMQVGDPGRAGPAGLLLDAALVLQFPLLHSWLLTPRGRSLLARLAPRAHGRTLGSTLFAAAAAVQLLLTFGLWSPSGVVWWRPEGALLHAFELAYGIGWLLLLKAMADAGLGLQTGSLGWTALWRGESPRYGGLPTGGLFRFCRQPIYLAFALILWSAPVWSPDRLALTLVWSLYCVLGPLHKERRYLALFGAEFERYRARVPYFLPLWPRGRTGLGRKALPG